MTAGTVNSTNLYKLLNGRDEIHRARREDIQVTVPENIMYPDIYRQGERRDVFCKEQIVTV